MKGMGKKTTVWVDKSDITDAGIGLNIVNDCDCDYEYDIDFDDNNNNMTVISLPLSSTQLVEISTFKGMNSNNNDKKPSQS